MTIRDRGSARVLTAALVAATAVALAGCNEDDPIPADGEPVGVPAPEIEETFPDDNRVVYEGQYNQLFIDESENYVGQQVTISGEVTRTLSPETFAIAGPANPMLIVEEQEIPAVDDGESVEITGVMQENFSVVETEEQLGIELDESLYADFEGENYVLAADAQIGDQE